MATLLTHFKNIISSNVAQDCMDMLIKEYDSIKDLYIKDMFRDFILEIFEYGPLWESKTSKYKFLDHNSFFFLHQIFKNGYYTINNEDARYFSNGKKRFLQACCGSQKLDSDQKSGKSEFR